MFGWSGKMQVHSLKCRLVLDGPGPSEAVVEVSTESGMVELIVDTALIQSAGYLSIGPVITRKNGSCLIDLPRESESGQMRVWVPAGDVEEVLSV
jgi:hypothetical protein